MFTYDHGTTRSRGATIAAGLLAILILIASSSAGATRSAVAAGAVATPTSESAVQILAVRAEKATTKPDWSFHRSALQQAALGQRTTLSAYIKLGTASPGNAITIVLVLTFNGRLLLRSTTAGIPPGDGTGEIWHHTDFVPQQAGAYSLSTRVEVNGTTVQTKATTFQVVRIPQPFVLRFSSLATLNAGRQRAQTFRRTDRVFVQAVWSETNTPAGAEANIAEELQYPGAKGWQTLGQPLITTFDTADGSHAFTFSFVPQTQYRSLRVLLNLAVGRVTQSQAVVIAVQ